MNHGSEPLTQVKTASIFSGNTSHVDSKSLLIETIGRIVNGIRKNIILLVSPFPLSIEMIKRILLCLAHCFHG